MHKKCVFFQCFAQQMCFFPMFCQFHLAHLAQDFSRCIDATYSEIFWIAARKPCWISAGCCFQQLWRAVFTEVGFGQLLHCWRFWQSDSQRSCAGVSMSQVPMASDGHKLTFPGWWPRFSVFQHMHRFCAPGVVDKLLQVHLGRHPGCLQVRKLRCAFGSVRWCGGVYLSSPEHVFTGFHTGHASLGYQIGRFLKLGNVS